MKTLKLSALLAMVLIISASAVAQTMYVANSSSNTVSVIDTTSNTVLGNITVGSSPRGGALNSDGSKAYVTNASSNNVTVIDTDSNTVLKTIAVGRGPAGIGATSTAIWVANSLDNTVSVISTSSDTVLFTIPVGSVPFSVAASPFASYVYVLNESADTVSVISTATNTVVNTFSVPVSSLGIALNGGSGEEYLATGGTTGKVLALSSGGTQLASYNVGRYPYGIAADSNYVYVTNEQDNTASIINLSSGGVTTVAIGALPMGIASTGTYAYASGYSSGNVSVIKPSTGTIVKTIPVGTGPIGLFYKSQPLPTQNNTQVGTSFNTSSWFFRQDMEANGSSDVSYSFTTTSNQIGLVSSSDALPPTLQFSYSVKVQLANADGSLQPVIEEPGFGNPVQYSSGVVGQGLKNQFIMQSTVSAPKYKWTIDIPPQQPGGGNYTFFALDVYTPSSN